MTATTATFLVTEADDESAVLRDVESGKIYTLADNDAGYEASQVVGATVEPVPPMDVVYEVVEEGFVDDVELVDSDLSPTTQAMEAAETLDEGQVERIQRAGSGELHVIAVPPERTEAAAQDVLDDDETIARAARVGAVRVEVRRDADAGVLNVRYLPD